jgi:anti-sigma B factor antagonist
VTALVEPPAAMTGRADGDRTQFRPEPFRCVVSQGRSSALVALHGELDLAILDAIESVLRGLAAARRSVVLDQRGLSFLNSSGLRLIVEVAASTRRDGHDFTIVRGSAPVQRLFEITGLDGHLVFVDAPEELAAGDQP